MRLEGRAGLDRGRREQDGVAVLLGLPPGGAVLSIWFGKGCHALRRASQGLPGRLSMEAVAATLYVAAANGARRSVRDHDDMRICASVGFQLYFRP